MPRSASGGPPAAGRRAPEASVAPRLADPATPSGRVLAAAVPLVAATAVGVVLGALSGWVADMRADRSLHTRGVVVPARLERFGADSGAAWVDSPGAEDVVVRFSRGGGLPAPWPDVHGLAVRHASGDLLLSGTGGAVVLRHLMAPARRIATVPYGSLLPFHGPRGPVMLAALPAPPAIPAPRALPGETATAGPWPALPEDLPTALASRPLRLDLAWAGLTGPWHVFGRLTVTAPREPAPDILRFDPAEAPAGLSTYPWVARLRTRAYAASRRRGPRDPGRPGRRPGGRHTADRLGADQHAADRLSADQHTTEQHAVDPTADLAHAPQETT